jgi:hypothetical protein
MPVPPRGNPPTSPTIDSVGKNALQPNAQDLNLKKEAPPTPFNPPDQKNPTCLYDSRGIKPAVEAGNSKLDAISGVLNAVQTVQLVGIDNKLGPQVSGGLSGAVGRVSNLVRKSWDFLQVDRVLSVLTYVTTLHNAMMLSNALSQTLFSAVGNVLAAIGIGKLEEDGSTSPMDIGAEVAKWTEGFFKGIFGVETVDGIKANWKKYNRIYQAAANIVWSVQSIGQSVLAALEVVGSHVAKIGNALKKWGEVGENAFTWMNPQPNFQNRFFTALQNTEEVVSQVDQVASEVLSAQQTITHIGQQKSDLKKAISETDPAVPGPGTSEALKIKDSADTAKSNSQSSAIAPDTLIKPGG